MLLCSKPKCFNPLVFRDDWDKQGDCDTNNHITCGSFMQRYLLRHEQACSSLPPNISCSSSSQSEDGIKSRIKTPLWHQVAADKSALHYFFLLVWLQLALRSSLHLQNRRSRLAQSGILHPDLHVWR
ncbi:hypothetical protein XENOCAPTIV_026294 [Xenoophorus captivus]|uniref:Uncharacterized protein n=1 Tax=Xenoophorus captivus TaxID=1517983 RepID=A0ABV0QP43_9TELE